MFKFSSFIWQTDLEQVVSEYEDEHEIELEYLVGMSNLSSCKSENI